MKHITAELNDSSILLTMYWDSNIAFLSQSTFGNHISSGFAIRDLFKFVSKLFLKKNPQSIFIRILPRIDQEVLQMYLVYFLRFSLKLKLGKKNKFLDIHFKKFHNDSVNLLIEYFLLFLNLFFVGKFLRINSSLHSQLFQEITLHNKQNHC